MTDNFTQGPWHVDIDKRGGNWTYSIRDVATTPNGIGSQIATVNQHVRLPPLSSGIRESAVSGNAALLAAAPDLLEALQEILPEISRLNQARGETVFNPTATNMARKAIARATQGDES